MLASAFFTKKDRQEKQEKNGGLAIQNLSFCLPAQNKGVKSEKVSDIGAFVLGQRRPDDWQFSA